MRNFRTAVAKLLPSFCARSGTASYVSGESFATSMHNCSGGEEMSGRKLMLIQEVCAGPPFCGSLGEVKSNLSLLGPGWR